LLKLNALPESGRRQRQEIDKAEGKNCRTNQGTGRQTAALFAARAFNRSTFCDNYELSLYLKPMFVALTRNILKRLSQTEQ
jgi:hypothetical protein